MDGSGDKLICEEHFNIPTTSSYNKQICSNKAIRKVILLLRVMMNTKLNLKVFAIILDLTDID